MTLNNIVEYDHDGKEIFFWGFSLFMYMDGISGFAHMDVNNYYMGCYDYGMGGGLPLWF